MNIKEFLLDNYIWIIVVILLAIITIIGFLADKKKGTKKNQIPQTNPEAVPNATSINYQQPTINSAQPINYQSEMINNQNNVEQNNNQSINMPINYNVAPNQNIQKPEGNMNTSINVNDLNNVASIPLNNINNLNPNMNINNPVPVENINQGLPVTPEPMYQPLSEQKPTFGPSAVNQINPIDNSNMLNLNANNNNTNNIPSINQIPIQMNQSIPQTNNQMNDINQNLQSNLGMMNQPMNFNPQPIPVQTPNTIPNPLASSASVNKSPVNFVYGIQQSTNDQNM